MNAHRLGLGEDDDNFDGSTCDGHDLCCLSEYLPRCLSFGCIRAPGMMSVVWLHAAPERHHRYDAKDGMVPKKELRAVFKSLRIRAKSVFATDSMVLIERINCQL